MRGNHSYFKMFVAPAPILLPLPDDAPQPHHPARPVADARQHPPVRNRADRLVRRRRLPSSPRAWLSLSGDLYDRKSGGAAARTAAGEPLPFRWNPPILIHVDVRGAVWGPATMWRAFRGAPRLTAQREAVILSPEMQEPPVVLVRRGIVYSAMTLANGRRAIPDIFLTGDIVGVEHAVAARARIELKAADSVAYSVLKPAKLRELMADQQTALRVMALAAKQGRQREQHIVALTRLDAHARIGAFLVGIYDRLREHQLISRPSFALPLTQNQIGDHLGLTMVHVSRTLRRLREERLVLVERQVVTITDLAGLRRVAAASDSPAAEIVGDELGHHK